MFKVRGSQIGAGLMALKGSQTCDRDLILSTILRPNFE